MADSAAAATSYPHDVGTVSSSIQDTSDNSQLVSEENMKKYNMYYTTSRLNIRLHDGSSSTPATYYLQSKTSLSEIQLLLRRGDAKTSPMVAFAKLRTLSRHALLGKGDLKKDLEGQIVWEELRREENLLHSSDYRFSTAAGNQRGTRAGFRWRKVREKTASTVYDCLDGDGDGKIVAKMASGGALNWRKGGEIQVSAGLDQGLEEMLVMSGLAVWTIEALQYRSLSRGFQKSES